MNTFLARQQKNTNVGSWQSASVIFTDPFSTQYNRGTRGCSEASDCCSCHLVLCSTPDTLLYALILLFTRWYSQISYRTVSTFNLKQVSVRETPMTLNTNLGMCLFVCLLYDEYYKLQYSHKSPVRLGQARSRPLGWRTLCSCFTHLWA